jgi:Protein of unknown function (DUF4232)
VAISTFIRPAVLGLTVALGVAGSSAGAAPLAMSSSSQTAPRLTGPPVVRSRPPCAAGSLGATYTLVFGSNATGHVEYTLTVTNHSRTVCAVNEPLALTLLGTHGQALPTDPVYARSGSYRVVLAAGQWAQAVSQLSPDLAGPGEPTRGNCEPVAHGLRITIGTASVRAPMDPTPVCQKGEILLNRLRSIRVTARCRPSALSTAFTRQEPPFDGFAEYALTVRNRSARACHTDSVLGLRLLGAHGRRLATRVQAGISSPYVIPAHVTETASARVATRGGTCDPVAPELAVSPTGTGAGGRVVAPISPPVAVCRRGLIELSTLFRNG